MSKIRLPTAKKLLLNLLLAADDGVLGVSEVIRAGALFGISANNARVALARLAAAGLVQAVERGSYRLAPAGRALAADVASWRELGTELVPWAGDWLAVVTAGLGRTDRGALRGRERALSRAGFAELHSELFVRPNNLRGGLTEAAKRLRARGLEASAPVFVVHAFESRVARRAERLWRATALERSYRDGVERLAASEARLASASLDDAARESFLHGDEGIRRLLFDPLLPEPIVSEAARNAYVRALRRYDDVGRAIWRRFLAGA